MDIQDRISAYTASGEQCCLSGVCIELPCLDQYAPNRSGCCCCPPKYEENVHDFKYFFEAILPSLHTGDIFLSSWPVDDGLGLNRCMFHSRSTHVGIIYRPSDQPEILQHRDKVHGQMVHESRPLILQVLLDGQCGRREGDGVELCDFEVYCKDYLDKFSHADNAEDISGFSISVRKLHGVVKDEAFYNVFERCVTKYWDTEYEEHAGNKTRAAIDCCQIICPCQYVKDDDSSLFCSELVAIIYRELGLLKETLSSQELLPSFFDTTRKLCLQRGAWLGPEHVCLGPVSLEERDEMCYGFPLPEEAVEQSYWEQDTYGRGGFWGVDTMRSVPICYMDDEEPDLRYSPPLLLQFSPVLCCSFLLLGALTWVMWS